MTQKIAGNRDTYIAKIDPKYPKLSPNTPPKFTALSRLSTQTAQKINKGMKTNK
jgi:hypothetical protein